MIKLATVGTSEICRNFLNSAFLTKEFSLEAVYSRKEETGLSFAKEFGCRRVFTSLEEMASDEKIEAVYIASPNAFHFSQSKIFLENGKHVICEKPAVTCRKEFEELKEIADEKGLIYMEAIIPRHAESYCAVKKAFSSIGRVQSARLDFCQYSSWMPRFLKGERVNIFDMSLHAGTLMDLGVYCVFAAVDFFGVPEKITAFKTLLPGGADGSGCAVFEYDGFNAVLTYSKTGQGSLGSEIIGENSALKIRHISKYSGVSVINADEEKEICGLFSVNELMKGEAQRFADYILRFEENKADYFSASELSKNVHGCLDEIKKSARLKYQ
ncbi:MAG: Gfo/Idh/MocA family oxidoreductase [Clostridia bacterium]|nr:Gfo/Idh/MocA family oxidoreductase [Clostridia bacterium]